eukprot:CAMPEP_0171730388 /NCGR_PEP_ID=MMETSP0991-20121206/28257_1 /TAXON_ID=483369 /ORGANISM="non described non described, Strain CCMP2098" /LENGTH=46 /DNA_ID= /DNA_START= /DNA_END= /DNA_ORIENTATION=
MVSGVNGCCASSFKEGSSSPGPTGAWVASAAFAASMAAPSPPPLPP